MLITLASFLSFPFVISFHSPFLSFLIPLLPVLSFQFFSILFPPFLPFVISLPFLLFLSFPSPLFPSFPFVISFHPPFSYHFLSSFPFLSFLLLFSPLLSSHLALVLWSVSPLQPWSCLPSSSQCVSCATFSSPPNPVVLTMASPSECQVSMCFAEIWALLSAL